MNSDQEEIKEHEEDEHEHDVVMPGFRFHPTEEELMEFYLRRKVEGKPFNIELITFLDLYRFDPWELPALAAMGEKEWYFYVPRDKKYKNGDRPNRVTRSGYWKATGADRTIRNDNSMPIGLKKTLVFYYGKAPRGTRTSWIMNEYRLPLHETKSLQKTEIVLCRVYSRLGIEERPSAGTSSSSSSPLPRTLQQPSKNLHYESPNQQISIQSDPYKGHLLNQKSNKTSPMSPIISSTTITFPISMEPQHPPMNLLQSKHAVDSPSLPQNPNALFGCSSLSSANNYSNFSQLHSPFSSHENPNRYSGNAPSFLQQPWPQMVDLAPRSTPQAPYFADRFWDWHAISEANKDFTDLFK